MHTEETKPQKSWKRELFEWVRALVIAVLAALLLTQVIIVNAKVPSESMEDTIMTGDRVIGNRLSYLFSEPERGDIIIFHFPDDESQLYVKRVVGLPGDTVEIRDGAVYLNGSATPLDESYVQGRTYDYDNHGPYLVPEGCYFVMGDNREHSYDSRRWDNTFVTEKQIVGRAWFRIWPSPTLLR